MLDIKFIRENLKLVKETAKNKLVAVDIDKLLIVDEKRLGVLRDLEAKRAQQNAGSKNGPKDSAELEKLKKTKEEIKLLEEEQRRIQKEFEDLMVQVPNIYSPDTPVGKNEKDNVEVYNSGKMPKFDFIPKDHIELGKLLDIIDFDRGVKVAGYRGYYLKNEGALLAMALMYFAMEKMVKKGYKPMIPPTLVKGFALYGSGYFKGLEYDSSVDEIYEVGSAAREPSDTINDKKFLVGTSEPSLLAYYSGETLKEEELPLKISGFSQCYRSEIGSYGKDTKGLYRVHEFMKVEQIVISSADIVVSDQLQKEMITISREIHEDLGLPFRQIQICSADMGLGKYKMFDTEVWLPGYQRWAETGSASNFLDWQARRLNVKYIDKNGDKKFAYLLNNTVLPTPRPLIAIIENYQTKSGTIKIPKVLQKYMFGIKEIKVNGKKSS